MAMSKSDLQSVIATLQANSQALDSLSQEEIIDKMELTDEERAQIKNELANPTDMPSLMLNPSPESQQKFAELMALNEKYQEEILKLLLGKELYEEMKNEELQAEVLSEQ